MLKIPVPTRSVIEALESRIAPAAFTVTTTDDSGPGSLRQAILDANALEGADTIGFNIEGEERQVIALTAPLPAITERLTISARLADQNELVRLDGNLAGVGAIGIHIKASNCVINGLEIANFNGSGVLIEGGNSNTIQGSHIFTNGGSGIHVNGGDGHSLTGNQIGQHQTSTDSTGNKEHGILITNSGGSLVLQGNYIKANGFFGIKIELSGSASMRGNQLVGNGIEANDMLEGGGIGIFNTPLAKIGASTSNAISEYNTISANAGHGILVKGIQSSGTIIAGNTVTANTGDGIHLDSAQATQVGIKATYYELISYTPNTLYYSGWRMNGNTISNNIGWGVATVNGAMDTAIKGNTLGGNGSGALLFDQVSTVSVGGLEVHKVLWYRNGIVIGSAPESYTTYDSNRIGFGSTAGAVVTASTGVQISSNSFSGTGLPIDLAGDGVTPNDPGDTDAGANRLQNHPSLLIIDGQLIANLATDSESAQYRIQVYKFTPSTGYTLYQTKETSTNSGQASLSFGSISLAPEEQIFATATHLGRGETSEMSTAAISQPSVSIGSATITEGNSGSQNTEFTIRLGSTSAVPVKVSYRSANDTATAGEDYAAVKGFVVFEPGETTKTISVPVFGDPQEEASERFYVDLTEAENAAITTFQGTGIITNDDGIPTISLEGVPAVVYESSAGSSAVPFTIKLSKPSLDPVTVRLRTLEGSAAGGADYSPLDRTITFAPGETSAMGTFFIYDDILREAAEVFELQLSAPTAGVLRTANATVTIIDDDSWVLEPANGLTIQEGNDGFNVAVMTVRLWSPVGLTDHQHPVSVDFATQNGTALAGSDFVAVQGTLVFQPGEFEKTITIPLIADTVAEQNETFRVLFSNRVGADLTRGFSEVLILNDDPGAVSVSAASTSEGNSGQKMMVFNVGLSAPTASAVSVSFETQGGSATAGTDFEAVAGTLTFAAGETTKTISVPIYGDRAVEGNETFTLKVTSGSGASASVVTAVGTILDDDPTLNIENAQFLEGQSPTSSTRTVLLPVRLTHATDIPVSVEFATSNGTAEASSDYLATSGTLVFAPGQTLQFIELQIVGDLDFEPDETFSAQLSNLQGAEMGQATGVVTLKPDEPFLSAQSVTLAEGNSGTKLLTFTVTLSQAQASSVTVDYATADGTATEGTDYTAVAGTLTFAPGETSKTVSVPILDDTLNEADETFRLLLSNATGVSIATAEIQGTIVNDDSPQSLPVLSVSNASLIEGNSGTSAMVFTLSLSKASTTTFSLFYSTEDGTATAGSDYTAVSGTLTFAPGETSKTVSVPVLGDTLSETDEIFYLQLLKAVGGANLINTRPTGTIISDDFPPSAVGLVVFDNGRKATWTDGDGDLVTLTSSKGVLASHNFQSGLDAGGRLSLQKLVLDAPSGKAAPANLTFSVLQSGTGDGLVNVEAIHSFGDLNKLSIPGRLGSLVAGDFKLKTPAVHKLMVDSFGLDSLSAEAGAAPLESSIIGNINRFVVKNDFLGAHLSVLNGGIRSLTVGGDLEGTSAAVRTGIHLQKSLKSLHVGGDIRGTDPLHPVEIRTVGAFHRIDVGGDVIHTNLIAGTIGGQKGVQAGKVVVQGDWTASNLAVGAGAGLDGLFGTEDDIVLQGTPSRIARITIGGTISGTAESEIPTDHFGFVAGRIAAFQVGGNKMSLASKWNDSSEIGSTSDVMLRELVGQVRA